MTKTATATLDRDGAGRDPKPRSDRRAWIVAVVGLIAVSLAVGSGLVGAPVVVVSVPFFYLLARRPLLRRLALRNASRRPRETILVVLGALLGTAIITSSFVVGDTLRSSIRDGAYTQLGPVDELVVSSGARIGAQAQNAIARAHLTGVDGTLALTAIDASVSNTASVPKGEPHAQVLETDFGDARAFGGKPAETGISGATPSPGQAVVGADLARTLDIQVGQTIDVHAYGASRALQVARVLPRVGVAGLLTLDANSNTSPNVFVAAGTIRSLQRNASAATLAVAPTVSLIAVSNKGDVISGAAGTAAVQANLTDALRGITTRVVPVKQELLENADRAGKQFTKFFQGFGYFSVLAGILLLVNIFVMLAEERKTALGMLRAIGLRRPSLVGSFSLEGWFYATAAAAAGTVAGVGVGRLVVAVASRVFQSGRSGIGSGLSLHFSVTTHSLRSGFTLGFLIALTTVVATSLYVARLNVIRAIRDLPEPPPTGQRPWRRVGGIVVGVVGAALTIGGIAGSNATLALIGPTLLGTGIVATLGASVPRRPLVSTISGAVLVWSVLAVSVVRANGILVFVVQGMVLTGSAIVLVTQNQEAIGAVVRTLGGGTRNMSLRLGLAYPLAKRVRTGLTIGMYAIVVFVLTLLVTISSLFSGQETQFVTKLAGTATIEVESNASDPVSANALAELPGVTHVVSASLNTAEFPKTGSTVTTPVKVVGFTSAFIGNGSPQLHTRASGISDDADAFRAVLANPDTVLVSQDFSPGARRAAGPAGAGVKIGQRITVRDPINGTTQPLTVAGIVSEAQYEGFDHVYVSQQTAQKVFGRRATSNLSYLSTSTAANADQIAATINGRFLGHGAGANTFPQLVSTQFSTQEQFFNLIKGYVALGLLVGIAGLGVVMIRAVRERRRQIGVLRALGFSRVAVRRAFVAESSFIAVEGIAIGASLALITSWRLVSANALGNGIAFHVPVLLLAPWLVGAFAASLLATARPAQQAAQIRPAVAIRIAD